MSKKKRKSGSGRGGRGGFACRVLFNLIFLGREEEVLFEVTLPIAHFANWEQTESRAMANGTLVFNLLANPDHEDSKAKLIESLRLTETEERSIAFAEAVSETSKEYELNQAEAYFTMRIKHKGAWLKVKITESSKSRDRWQVFEVASFQVSKELNLDWVQVNADDVMEPALKADPTHLIADLM